MIRKNYQPDGLFKRVVEGQTLYYHVVSVEGPSRIIYVAGQLARNIDGGVVAKGDMGGQIRQVGKNITLALEAAGATLDDIVKTNTYTTDIDEFFKHVDARMEFFRALPTSTTVEVRRLQHPDLMVEVEVMAMK